jgi:phosphatidate cytidylyltransferase
VLATRIWTAAIALPAVVAAIVFLPPPLFSLFILILGAWGLYEVASMSQARTIARQAVIVAVGGVPLLVLLTMSRPPWIPALAVFAIMMAVVAMISVGGPAAGVKGLALTIVGAAWVGVTFPYFALLRNSAGGIAMVMLVFLLVVASDTGAYFVGKYLGRIKLAPMVSPHKTVEGALAAIVASEIAGVVLAPLLAPSLRLGRMLALSGAVAVLAIVGDLAGSALKRSAGVKDSGWLFPGHGGLLDRTCSLVFAVVFAYYWLT